jgi:hypothetical protein
MKDLSSKHSKYISAAIMEAEKSDFDVYRLGACFEAGEAYILRSQHT